MKEVKGQQKLMVARLFRVHLSVALKDLLFVDLEHLVYSYVCIL